jgi:hypothetical protein
MRQRGRDFRPRVNIALTLQRQRVITERGGVGLELLVAARDIEDHVLVRDQAVRDQETLERELLVGALVVIGAE